MNLSIAVSVLVVFFSSDADGSGMPKLRTIESAVNANRRTLSSITACDTDVHGCLEVVIDPKNVCDDDSVTYCLQDRATTCKDGTSGSCGGNDNVCISNPDNDNTYSHVAVYVNGETLTTETTTAQATFSCSAAIETCDASSNNCNMTNLDNTITMDLNNTIGLKCNDGEKVPVCVTVQIDADGNHAEVVFSVKDGNGCSNVGGSPWECSNYTENNCGCGGAATCAYSPKKKCAIEPSSAPTDIPSIAPSSFPTSQPSASPSLLPSSSPTGRPSLSPSATPTQVPSSSPSLQPSSIPSKTPSSNPSASPSSKPSDVPS
eukprot:CAMPEP_0194227390 /NCGR_PEP_ID=MMETSP0156-20130528/42836_1 /TAXON_ID=33649 /ORGANISM="Thalassionema nitzschioides, Strain L26-B" /LENGTH=317 /DNA_ID=CAMNT_0038959871 /DNA_START=585 /DNA_END=1534 /DNA_ORIENTATION=+